MNDWQLLRRYIDEGSEQAFAQLVDRHKALVYWTCRRDIRDEQLAEDAAQSVFIILARKAGTLRRNASLTNWLFTVARNVSRKSYASELSRRRNEERLVTQMQSEMNRNDAWERVEPQINDALTSLSDPDRAAVLMRYVDNESFSDIATALGTSEEAARKRATRGLDRLRSYLAKRNVAVPALVLAAVLTDRAASGVPETCVALSAKSILAAATAHSAAIASASWGSLLLNKGATILMDLTVKKVILVAGLLVLAGGVTTVVLATRRVPQAENVATGASFADVAPRLGVDTEASRKLIDYEVASWTKKDMLESAAIVQQAISHSAHGDGHLVDWMGKPSAVSMTLRQLEVSGNTATTSVDIVSVFKVTGWGGVASGSRLELHATYRDNWKKVRFGWVGTTRTVVGKPSATFNGGPLPSGKNAWWDVAAFS